MKRRDFIRNSFLIGAGFTFLPHPAPWIDRLQASPISSRIIDITDPNVFKNASIDSDILEKMLDGGIGELYQRTMLSEYCTT